MQVSDQCVKLVKAGWFDQQQEPSGVSTLTDPKVSIYTAVKADHPDVTVFSICLEMHATILSTAMLLPCPGATGSADKRHTDRSAGIPLHGDAVSAMLERLLLALLHLIHQFCSTCSDMVPGPQ